mgnify:CR=1 FL=1
MNHFLKGAAAAGIVIIASMAVNIFCNTHGINLDSTGISMISPICSILLYHGFIRNEKK